MNPTYRVKPDDGYGKYAAEDVVEEDEDAAENESESEDGSVPSLETDLSSDDDQINIPGIEGRSSPLRDHVDQNCPQPFDERALTPPHLPSIWDPPEHHGAQLHEFLHSTREKILDRLFVQVLRMRRYLEEQRRLNLILEYEVLLEGLFLLMMMGSNLDRIAEISRDPAHVPK